MIKEPKEKDGRVKNGGHKNSGRKVQSDVAIPVTAYIKESRIVELGGIEVCRVIAKEYLQDGKINGALLLLSGRK